jgi:hypothetical protein
MAKTWQQMTVGEKLWHLKGETEMLHRMMGATQDALQDVIAKDQSNLQSQIDESGKRLSKLSSDEESLP